GGTRSVGQAKDPVTFRPVVVFWDIDEPGIPVHVLPDLGPPGHPDAVVTRATGVSGTRIVGLIAIPGTDQLQAVFWDTAEPGIPVHVLPALGGLFATPNGVSGPLVVGASTGRAVFWNTAEPGTPVHVLPDLGGGGVFPQALGVSGTLIVGLVGIPS